MDENEICKYLQERSEKLRQGWVQAESLLCTLKESKDELEETTLSIEVARERIGNDIKINDILRNNSQKLSGCSRDEFDRISERDENWIFTLNALKNQSVELNSYAHMMAATGSTIPLLVSSSTSSAIMMTVGSLNDPGMNEEFENVKSRIHENIEFISQELDKFSPDLSQDFKSAIKDWFSSDKRFKYKSISNLRNILFYRVFKEVSPERDYGKSPWFKKGKPQKYHQVKFFILGPFGDDSKIPQTQKDQIERIADNMERIFHDMSEKGNYGAMNLDVLFENLITDYRIMIELRKTFHNFR